MISAIDPLETLIDCKAADDDTIFRKPSARVGVRKFLSAEVYKWKAYLPRIKTSDIGDFSDCLQPHTPHNQHHPPSEIR